MLLVILNWIYMAVTMFCLGCGFSAVCGRLLGYRIKRIDSLLMAGMGIATVYAQFFSLLGAVGLWANLLLVVTCILIVVLCFKQAKEYVLNARKGCSVCHKVLLLLVIVLWAFCTSRGYIHYDTDLYHAQSIRWIEEYGVVPGLGNLHERFAYNSSFFAVSALYSMKFMTGTSLHAVSGFFALLLSVTALDIMKSWKNKKFSLSDFARVGAIYYLTTIMEEVVSPASDYSIMCMIFYIIIKWLDVLENQEKREIAPYALLCVAGVYALTLKLTAGLILLLLAKPAYLLIKEKRWKEIMLYLGMGLITAIPWFVRTVMISGWLVYPFPALDLFGFDWKMDAAAIEVDAAQIKVWGRGLYDVALVNMPLTEWFPHWFGTTLSGTEKLLILGCLGCIAVFVITTAVTFMKKQWKHLEVLLVLFTLICSYLFWQWSAPLLRYGYAYVLLVCFVTAGFILEQVHCRKVDILVYFAIIVYGLYKLFPVGEYIYGCRLSPYYIRQAEYGIYEVESYEIEGITFYKPVTGDRTGYEYFPAAPTKPALELRGEDLKEGFRKVN